MSKTLLLEAISSDKRYLFKLFRNETKREGVKIIGLVCSVVNNLSFYPIQKKVNFDDENSALPWFQDYVNNKRKNVYKSILYNVPYASERKGAKQPKTSAKLLLSVFKDKEENLYTCYFYSYGGDRQYNRRLTLRNIIKFHNVFDKDLMNYILLCYYENNNKPIEKYSIRSILRGGKNNALGSNDVNHVINRFNSSRNDAGISQ